MTAKPPPAKDFAVLLGGDVTVTARLRKQMLGRRVIAADSGIRHAQQLGAEVELWVGDFDSASDADKLTHSSVNQRHWSAAKDMTDGEIALEIAVGEGATSILIVGAFGGRTAHANNHLLMAFNQEREIILTSGVEEAIPLESRAQPEWPNETIFSILAFDELKGLSVIGARWPLDNVTVPAGSGWTLSNEVDGQLSASLESGRAMLIGELTA